MCFNYYLPEAVLQNLHVNFSPTSVGMDIILVKKLGTSWPAQTATTAEEEKSEDTDQCPSQYGKGTSCGRTNEEGWSESLVGKLAWLVPNCHRLFNQAFSTFSRLHPAVVILALAGIGFVLVTAVYVRVWYLIQQSRK